MATKQKQGNRFIQNKIEGEAQTFTFDFIIKEHPLIVCKQKMPFHLFSFTELPITISFNSSQLSKALVTCLCNGISQRYVYIAIVPILVTEKFALL